MRLVHLVSLAAIVCIAFGCASSGPSGGGAGDSVAHTHFCACDAKCTCKTSATTEGTCPCGKALAAKRVLRTTDDSYQICGCGGECQCNELHDSDEGSCRCGKPLASFPRTAAYTCGCDASCGCKSQSNTSGTCACGKALVAR